MAIRSRSRRIMGALAVVSITAASQAVVFVSPAGAEELGAIQDVGHISIRSNVNPDSAPWVLDLDVTFEEAPDCTVGAEVHFQFLSRTGKQRLCSPGGAAGLTARIRVPVFGTFTSDTPSSSYVLNPTTGVYQQTVVTRRADVTVRDLAPAQDLGFIGRESGHAVVELPTAPVIVGLGDGYTSARVQSTDGCVTAACHHPDDVESSWTGLVAQPLASNAAAQFGSGPGSAWNYRSAVLAHDGATSDELAGSQLAALVELLGRHTVTRADGSKLPSWNWVGISSGFVDVGLDQVMEEYTTILHPYDNPASPRPWAASTASECPDLDAVLASAESALASGAIKDDVRSVISAAEAASPGIHAVQLLYPWLTETSTALDGGTYTNPCASDNATSVSNRTVIDRLNEAVDVANESSTDRVYPVDLRTLFGEQPVGTIPNGTGPAVRVGNYLATTRPYGYPFPTWGGRIGQGVVEVIESTGPDLIPPLFFVHAVQPSARPSGPVWWNLSSVDLEWSAEDVSGLADPGNWPVVTQATLEGVHTYHPPYPACDVLGNCVTPSFSMGIDRTPPPVAVSADREPNEDGWYDGPVTLTWSYGEDSWTDGDGAYIQGSGGDYGLTYQRVVTASESGQSFTNPAGTMCDVADNCRSVTSPVILIDQVEPAVGLAGGPAGGALQPIEDGGTLGGSGAAVQTKGVLAAAPSPTTFVVRCTATDAQSGIASCVHERTEQRRKGGSTLYTYVVTATDLAGNWSTRSISFTAPSGSVDEAPTTLAPKRSGKAGSTSATFELRGKDDRTAAKALRFECRLDGAAFVPCADPVSFSGLAAGGHTLQVRAIDGAGNVDGTPASVRWTVDPPD
jgi:hypothetical protein